MRAKIQGIDRSATLAALPPPWSVDLRSEIRRLVRAADSKIAVLDDDPTGTQTVHGIPVLTEWSRESIQSELVNDGPAFYLLTNSRSMPEDRARSLNALIGRRLLSVAQKTGRRIAVISRSDSTLRGHFPEEVQALADGLQTRFDGWILIPFFPEGGRYTINDIHYVEEGESFVPAGETAFARDKVFGYRSSNLCDWVEEKTKGRVKASQVLSISIEDLRLGGPELVTEKLMTMRDGRISVVNAASYRDLEVFTVGLLAAEDLGKQFLYRTAASFVQVRAGLKARPLLTRGSLVMPETGGGLTVVGSYVPRTTYQVQELLKLPGIVSGEVSVQALLDSTRRKTEINRVAGIANDALRQNQDVLIYTSRDLVAVDDPERSLNIGTSVSEGLIAALDAITVRPRYLIAKGGITSSDVATKALGVRRAMVQGQILPGVPLWELGPESRWPGMPFVVFPGNVGAPVALARAVATLRLQETEHHDTSGLAGDTTTESR